ncbi:fluoride efflux transporter FluC [Shimazuella kribbensis]|uniref:fluoride efflux transporter FluC n=1 Tax=Shimazuella kribbensis TaxID=139808 RepID=UPI000409CD4A|nr:CrcB family protein [Shimazuella kribbensis]
MIYVTVGIAGAIGALLRYTIGLIIPSTSFFHFPISTLLINLIGCLCLSWFFSWIHRYAFFPAWAHTAIITGLIGSFTTFSTFQLEFIQLIEKNYFYFAFLYLFLSGIGGYVFSLLGMYLAKTRGDVS